MKIIDPHIHLFNLLQGDYHWLKAENPPFWQDKANICKNYRESDLSISPHQLVGYVHIEAGFDNQQPWRELEWVEQQSQLPVRTVANIDLLRADIDEQLQLLLPYKSVVGVRHIFDQHAATLLSTPQVRKNLNQIAAQGLHFELQMAFTDDVAVNQLADFLANSSLKVLINHAGFPPFDSPSALWPTWQNNISRIAEHENCAIKCSGWEMQARQWLWPDVLEVVQECVSFFGIERVMLASNFPLLELSQSYQDYWSDFIDQLPYASGERDMLVHDNAQHWYRF